MFDKSLFGERSFTLFFNLHHNKRLALKVQIYFIICNLFINHTIKLHVSAVKYKLQCIKIIY